MATIFDGSRLPEKDRMEGFRSVFVRETTPHHTVFLRPRTGPVNAKVDLWRLNDDVQVMRLNNTGVMHRRSEQALHATGPERVAFVVHDGSPGRYEHAGHARTLSRGTLYLTDLNAAFTYSRSGEGAAIMAQIERDRLGVAIEQVYRADSRLSASPFYDLVRRHIAGTPGSAAAMGERERTLLAGITAQLMRALIVTSADPESAAGREALQDHLVDRIRSYIALHFRDPGLTADRIAHEHAISVRHLFRLWTGQGASLGETIMAARLEAARQELVAHPAVPVGHIAHRCGFVSVSHFSRRFRAAFACSPTQWRVESAGSPASSPGA
ncbi:MULTISPECIES: helix-turn-helix transcriptional regulator [unclassified Streptomyces]|uniref:helix-turn-helix transcriptional regulator n=2 Tax=unclassified Streptomyces TaxID=2593676 RepID=UPI00368482AB